MSCSSPHSPRLDFCSPSIRHWQVLPPAMALSAPRCPFMSTLLKSASSSTPVLSSMLKLCPHVRSLPGAQLASLHSAVGVFAPPPSVSTQAKPVSDSTFFRMLGVEDGGSVCKHSKALPVLFSSRWFAFVHKTSPCACCCACRLLETCTPW